MPHGLESRMSAAGRGDEETTTRLRFQVTGAHPPQRGERLPGFLIRDLGRRPIAPERRDGAVDGPGVGAVGAGTPSISALRTRHALFINSRNFTTIETV